MDRIRKEIDGLMDTLWWADGLMSLDPNEQALKIADTSSKEVSAGAYNSTKAASDAYVGRGIVPALTSARGVAGTPQ